MSTPTTPRPLVLGEIAKVEELSGLPASQWGEDAPRGKFLAALVFVYKRREDKTFTWNDALGLDFEEASAYLESQGFNAEDDEDEGGAEDPTEPAKKPAKKAARSRPASKTSGRSSAS